MKLIIRAPNWVGDAVMALPAVDNARDLTGASHIAVMANRSTAPLFAHHPDVDQMIEIGYGGSKMAEIRRAADAIKDERFDVGIVTPPSFSSALIFRLGKVRGRIGYRGDGRSLLLTRAVKQPRSKIHRVRLYLHLLEVLTGKNLESRPPQVYLSHKDIDEGEKLLNRYGLTYDTRYVVIAPQAVAESRRWGTGNYSRLAEKIVLELDARILLLGTSSDLAAGEAVKSGNQNIVNLCGGTSLLSAAAILSFARLFGGNDSGLAHLAGAVGCPLLVLSGPDDPEETSPMCDNKRVIIKDINCISCVKNVCPKSGDGFMRCMKLISVDEVFDAARETILV